MKSKVIFLDSSTLQLLIYTHVCFMNTTNHILDIIIYQADLEHLTFNF